MKKPITSLMMACFMACLGALNLHAQTDVTDLYLTNSGFDSQFDYTVSDQGNVAQEILDVEGWITDIDADYTITGVYEYGTSKTFNGVGIPSEGYNGSSGGGLALSTGWGTGLKFYQEATLPEGRYALVTTFYNSSTVRSGSSLVGWIPQEGNAVMSDLTSFPSAQWVVDTVYFSLPAETAGKIQIGLLSIAGVGSGSTAKVVLDFVQLLSYGVDKTDLISMINQALELYGAGEGNQAEVLHAVLTAAISIRENAGATMAEIIQAIENLDAAIYAYRLQNPTGPVPTVVTHPEHARGATMAFGRSTLSGVASSDLLEHGFCWSTHPEPTIFDEKTTSYFTNNGYIYRMDNLEPATVYYMRAYALTKEYALGYGEVIKVITLPRGTVTYSIRDNATGDHRVRITEAVSTAVQYFNDLTSIQGHHISAGYGSGTQTAEASYGGWMTFGPNASYQRTGTALHEMGHTIGVGQHRIWYGPDSPLRANGTTGQWLGERANKVVRFLENDPAAVLTGDATHMWPYGINGASEDTGSEFLYIANSLIHQGLGEDGLPPTGGFTTPAYTFESDENVKYYIKSEAETRGRNTSYLMENESGNIVWTNLSAEDVLANDHAAWYFEFNPATCYYQIRNAATGKYFSYKSTGTNGIGLVAKDSPTSTENFQLKNARISTIVGTGSNTYTTQGYWVVRPEHKLNPTCFAAAANGATTATTFSLENSANTQRWLFLTAEELTDFEATLDGMILADLKVNGTTLPGFSSDVETYEYLVAPDAEADEFTVEAEAAVKFDGTLEITQVATIPGSATVKAWAENGVARTYTIHFEKSYTYQWDGNGATGTGSAPTSFGWASTPSVTWNTANGSGGNRYMDPGNGEYSSYTFEGADFAEKRILWIRYNNKEEFTYDFNGLEAGRAYKLNFKYGWHNNASAPEITVGVYEKTRNSLLAQSSYTASSTKRELKAAEIAFAVPASTESNQFYLSIKNTINSDCMLILTDISVIDDGGVSAVADIRSEGAVLNITSSQGGVYVSGKDGHTAGIVRIYSVTGQIVCSVEVATNPVFVPLHAGVYIIGTQKVVVMH